jgi:hypothetical protein
LVLSSLLFFFYWSKYVSNDYNDNLRNRSKNK